MKCAYCGEPIADERGSYRLTMVGSTVAWHGDCMDADLLVARRYRESLGARRILELIRHRGDGRVIDAA
jgi:hypothetical protein